MSGSGAGGQKFGVRLSLDGAEAVESGLRRVQATAQQSQAAVQQSGESAGRALTVIERGTAVASAGLTKLGGDFAALVPIVDNAGGAVGRIVTALGTGAGLLGVLGGVGAAVTAAVALYQNWDTVSRATATAIDFLTGRVRLNEAAINDANAALRAYLQLSETAAQAGNRRFIQTQRDAGDAARGRVESFDTELGRIDAAIATQRAGGATGRVIERGGASGLVPTDEFGQAANRAVQDRLAAQRAAEIARLEGQREEILRARRGQQAIVDRSEAAIAGAVSDQSNTTPGRPRDEPPAAASARGGGGGGGGGGAARVNDALRDRDALIQRNITADERYAQGMARIADLNDRLIAQGNDPLPDEQVQREAVRLMEEYERATQRAGDATRSAADDSREFARLATGTAKALSGAFEDLVFEGKNFDDVLKDLERSLLRLGNQFFLQPLFQQGLNSLFGGQGGAGGGSGGAGGVGGLVGSLASSLFGSGGGNEIVNVGAGLLKTATSTMLFHDGGIIGAAGRPGPMVPAAIFADAPRFHSGGLIGPDERPIIAQVGERVLNRQETAEYARGGGRGITVNINGVTNPNEFRQSQSQITAQLARALGRSGRNR